MIMALNKIIKKIKKTVWLMVFLFTVLLLFLFGMIHFPFIQSKIIGKVTVLANEKLGVELFYSKARLRPLNTLYFEDFLLKDLQNDTLIASKQLKITIKGILPKVLGADKKDLYLKKIIIQQAYIRLYSDEDKGFNLVNFINELLPPSDDKTPKPFNINEIQIIDSKLGIFRTDTLFKEGVFDPSHMVMNDFSLRAKQVQFHADTVNMQIKNLSFKDHSGFEVRNLKSNLYLCKSFMHFDAMEIRLQRSEIELEKMYFYFDGFYQFGEGRIFENVRFDIEQKNTHLNLADLGNFTPLFKNTNQFIEITGAINGTISNLNLRDFNIRFGNKSYLRGNFDLNGLPNKDELFIIADFEPFFATKEDLANFTLPQNKHIVFPKNFSQLTYINYMGNFTGLVNDFVSFGAIRSDYGDINTDIILQPDTTGNIHFIGNVITNNFKLGTLIEKPDIISTISSNVRLQGSFLKNGGIKSTIKGKVHKIGVNNYDYRTIEIDGDFSQKSFNGALTVDDKNLALNFEGLVDFNDKLPQFNFFLDVNHAELNPLGFSKKEMPFSASFVMDMKGTGNSSSNINADINLLNSLLTKGEDQIQIYGLNLNLQNDSSINKISLKSDIIDANLQGKYTLSQLPNCFLKSADQLFPSLLISDSAYNDIPRGIHFDYNVNLKNIQPTVAFFLNNIQIADNTFLNGDYYSDSIVTANLHVESKLFRIKKNKASQLNGNITLKDSVAHADFGCNTLLLANRFFLDNYTFSSTLKPDSVTFTNRWLNWDTLVQKGAITGSVFFIPQLAMKPKLEINMDKVSFILKDYVWETNSFNISIDSSGFKTNNISLAHEDQYLKIAGGITSNQLDSLVISVNDFNLSNLNLFSRNESTKLRGSLNGHAIIAGKENNVTFNSDITVDTFALNNKPLGDIKLYSYYDIKNKLINVDLTASRGNLKTLSLKGDYFPGENGKIDMNCDLNQFRLEFVAPFVKNIFANLEGDATGNATIIGTLKKPLISGKVKLQETKFGFDYLKTEYTFATDLAVSNNNLLLNNITLIDSEKNTALVNGNVFLKKFTEVYLNLNVQTTNFLCLNTTIADNSKYYGKAYIDGLVRIFGANDDLQINVDAVTSKGTVFNVPLMESGDASRYSYIVLIDTDSTETENDANKLIVEDERSNLMQLDFNLNVTQDATIQIVFDPQIGDVIKANGNGEMDIALNNVGDFKMVGEYIIEKGEYLFTLQNVFNKKFNVQSGSSIRWSGDPLNANIDIDAYYPTKASLYNLFGNEFSTDQSQSRVNVNCELNLTGNLMQPQVGYDITLPNAEPGIQERVTSKLSTEEKLSKQFLSLLVLNQFLLDESAVLNDTATSSNTALMAGGSNATELLSNQFSNWLSQISDDVDIGVNYRPGSQVSSHEVEVALSTQLLNDRLSINGSVDMKTNAEAENVNRVVGDIDADYKLIPSGKVRLRAFNRSNNQEITEYSPYTQGIGIFYMEDFDTFGELWSNYIAFFRGDRKKKKNQTK